MKKGSLARTVGAAVTGFALVGWVALPVMAEAPSHGFHHHPVLPPAVSNHKPHPSLNPPPAPHGPPVAKPHAPHAHHKPHPGLNPFAPGQ